MDTERALPLSDAEFDAKKAEHDRLVAQQNALCAQAVAEVARPEVEKESQYQQYLAKSRQPIFVDPEAVLQEIISEEQSKQGYREVIVMPFTAENGSQHYSIPPFYLPDEEYNEFITLEYHQEAREVQIGDRLAIDPRGEAHFRLELEPRNSDTLFAELFDLGKHPFTKLRLSGLLLRNVPGAEERVVYSPDELAPIQPSVLEYTTKSLEQLVTVVNANKSLAPLF